MARLPNRLPVLGPALLSLALGACPAHHRARPDGEQLIADPQELFEAMRAARPASLRVAGTIDMRRKGKRIKAHMVYLVRQPAWVRFETESFFDQPLSILVSDGMTFSAWDMKEGRFVRGPATPANIAQVIPVPMDGPAMADILTGFPPLIPYAQAELRWEDGRGLYHLELSNARLRQHILVDPTLLRTVEVRVHDAERMLYQLAFEDWMRFAGRPVAAMKIRFEMPAEQIKVRIKARKAEPDVQLSDELFELEPPADLPIEVWD